MSSQPVPFRVDSERTGRLHRLTPVGELDLATVSILETEFKNAYRALDASTVVVDLTQLSFIDSTGLHLLIRMNAEIGGSADRLRIINGSTAVERLLDISGLRGRLPIIHKGTDPLTPLRSPSEESASG